MMNKKGQVIEISAVVIILIFLVPLLFGGVGSVLFGNILKSVPWYGWIIFLFLMLWLFKKGGKR